MFKLLVGFLKLFCKRSEIPAEVTCLPTSHPILLHRTVFWIISIVLVVQSRHSLRPSLFWKEKIIERERENSYNNFLPQRHLRGLEMHRNASVLLCCGNGLQSRRRVGCLGNNFCAWPNNVGSWQGSKNCHLRPHINRQPNKWLIRRFEPCFER